MSARVVRIGFLLAAVTAALALAPPASAAITPSHEPSSTSECTGPCPTAITIKGNGSGWITTNPNYFSCDTNQSRVCVEEIPDAVPSVTLTVHVRDGSYLQKSWENCPNPPVGRDCTVHPQQQGGSFTMCVVISLTGTTSPEEPCPPPIVFPPSAPAPPIGPPPLGSRCTIKGTARADVINGTPGRDVICGRGGNDRINGRGDHDLILGGTGRDRLVGGSGRDAIYGNSANDTFLTRDGARDTVNGGRGRDRARWDTHDVRRSIERRL